MRMKAYAVVFMLSCTLKVASQFQFPLGAWREHLPYNQAIGVVHTNNVVWMATPFSLLRYDPVDREIERKSKVNGLSESGITAIGANQTSGKLVVAYTNSNIDIIDYEKIFNITDIRNSNISGDKSINHVLVLQDMAYLSSGLGIIVLDLIKMEVKDTYVIGESGNRITVLETAISNNFLYAATTEGLKRVSLSESNPADFTKWNLVFPANNSVKSVFSYNNSLFFRQNDSLFMFQNGTRTFFYADGWKIQNETVSASKLLLSESTADSARIIEISPTGFIDKIIGNPYSVIHPSQAIYFQDLYWIADSVAGLSSFDGNVFNAILPNSPAGIALGDITSYKDGIWATAGAVTDSWQSANRNAGIYAFTNEHWTNHDSRTENEFDSIRDIITIVIDRSDGSAWAGSFGDGLIHISNKNNISHFKLNSPLESSIFSPGSIRVSGLAFDSEQNLWISNYGAVNNLQVKKKNSNWIKFPIPLSLIENAVADILIDDYDQKWIISPKNGLIVFNHGQQIDNTGDDTYRLLRSGRGLGNLPDNEVLSIATDKNGLLWIGTAKGIGIIPCAAEIFTSSGCETVIPIVQQDNFPGYLFKEERVQAIAVDGANRKWIGTRSGAWLISAEGEKTIYRFTKDNSPLPDNDIRSITINGMTGEVFFGTIAGIYSFRGTATESTDAKDNILIFPNPVPPGYTGSIAIRGMLNNPLVKITESDGRLVFETKALGGQAVWNGKDYRGRKVSSGVYLVLISDESGKQKLAGKIVVIKK